MSLATVTATATVDATMAAVVAEVVVDAGDVVAAEVRYLRGTSLIVSTN